MDQQKYRVEVVNGREDIDPRKSKILTEKFTNLSVKASAGSDWAGYIPGQVGWKNYYETEGARPEDYDRISLVYVGDELIHFIALNVFWLDETHPILWIHIAITDPSHQGAGVLTMSSRALLAPEWVYSVARLSYAVFRTPNPIVYEAMRSFAREHQESDRLQVKYWYPELDSSGTLREIPQAIHELAGDIAKRLSPECEWDPVNFVIRGYFKQFGPLYKADTQFNCRVDGTNIFFANNVHLDSQDGLLVIFALEANVS